MNLADCFQKLSRRARLRQEDERRELERSFDKLALRVGGVNNHREVSPIFSDLLESGGTVELGHSQVEQNNLWCLLTHRLEGFIAPGGRMHIVAIFLEQLMEHL